MRDRLGKQEDERQQREYTPFFLLGGFFVVMGALVLIGTLWTFGRAHAMIVNFVAGLTLTAIGCGMLTFGLHLRRRATKETGRVG
jgi:hypothetical protein